MLKKIERMKTETRTKEWFLNDPRCRKWIVQCVSCLQYGRKKDTPILIPKYRFEEMFPVLELDKNGQCAICQEAGK